MSTANFNLKHYRLERVTATALDVTAGVTHDMEMKFVIGFHEEAPADCDFSITIQLHLSRITEDNDAENAVYVQARGAYKFEEGATPYEVHDPLERAFAISLLYGSMRPAVETLVNNIGFDGLNLPLSLPIEIAQAEPGNAHPTPPLA